MHFVSQNTHNGCALACLDMILLENGINLTRRNLSFIAGDDPILSLLDIINVLKYFKIESKAFLSHDKDLDELCDYKIVLIHEKKHFYIVEKMKEGDYYVYDPAGLKPTIQSKKQIEKRWDGYFLVASLNKYPLPLFCRNPFIAFKTKLILFSIIFFSLLFLYLLY